MIISLIVAMDEKRGIGKAGKLPWRLSSDLKTFRELTMGHHVIVGRKTFESIGKLLPGRQMIVVSRDRGFKPEGCLVAGSVQDALNIAQEHGETELFVIGGAEIYSQTLQAADRLYLTQVHAEVDADTFFPELNFEEWNPADSSFQLADEKNEYAFTFTVLIRKRH
nr:Dihydrofolate reductase [uncultured bacterium]